MRKIIMILVMSMVAFGSFAKSFEYKADDIKWTYDEDHRKLDGTLDFAKYEIESTVQVFDVSEEEAWKVINGEEFPTFEFLREEDDDSIFVALIPARDYSNRGN